MYLIRHGQSEFNAAFSVNRVDPGITDPVLTPTGLEQAQATARQLLQMRGDGIADIRRLIVSPYTRTVQTAEIIAAALDAPITIDARVRERAAFMCDVGTHRDELARRFPRHRFDHLDHPWWHDHIALGVVESEAILSERSAAFCAALACEHDWRHVAVITHFGFIRSLIGRPVANGEVVRLDLTAPLPASAAAAS